MNFNDLTEFEQICLVRAAGRDIRHLINAGIPVSDTVKKNALNNDGRAIEYIKNPSAELQKIAVENRGVALKYILDMGIIPSETVQIAAVANDCDSIHYLIQAGITPSFVVQFAAVRSGWRALYWIVSAGIEPDRMVQMVAVRQNVQAASLLKNPSPRVLKYLANINTAKKTR